MTFNERILVVLDSSPLAEQALQRSRLIAQKTGAVLDIMWRESVLPDRPVMQLLARLITAGIPVEQYYGQSVSLLKDIESCWQRQRQALIIKGCDESHRDFWTPLDWQLLRRMPCPVLLVKHDRSWHKGTILAAVEPSENMRTDTLSTEVLRLSEFVATQAEALCRVVAAYPPPMLSSEPDCQNTKTLQYKSEARIEKELTALGLTAFEPLVGEGPPDYWIPAAAQQTQAHLVVMGTHGREGLSGALLGNTAERILDRLHCDVLVMKAAHAGGIAALLTKAD